ncbi:hypothetical protein DID78_07050 [Candidatus Marinamargulisbacteria bacterium SCGC AG-343-D04]|nr:hypothetical protein DID78_07050 [Candidatus Marinamargulisbacteria bacterium SCGC AG-343-D04]
MPSNFFLRPHEKIQIGSHRGICPQKEIIPNTAASLNHAREMGADYYECDINMTRDNELVCFHDQTINGKPINEHKYSELPSNIPNFESLVKELKSRPIGLYIELKYHEVDPERQKMLAKKALEVINTHDILKYSLIASFDPILLKHVKDHAPSIPIALNIELEEVDKCAELTKQALGGQLRERVDFYCPNINQLPKLPKELPKKPLLVWEHAGTLDIYDQLGSLSPPEEREAWLSEKNIVGLTTNHIKNIQSLL